MLQQTKGLQNQPLQQLQAKISHTLLKRDLARRWCLERLAPSRSRPGDGPRYVSSTGQDVIGADVVFFSRNGVAAERPRYLTELRPAGELPHYDTVRISDAV